MTIDHKADICVIGGGFAGICAAISAARHGCSTVLVHDRPVLGGNASSEIRMWPLGAGREMRELGIYDEIMNENMRVNPNRTYPVWDSVLFGAVKGQERLETLLNCSVFSAECDGGRITSVTGWQLTTYQHHRVTADIFIDCSGDSILADLSGAQYRVGRESADQFGESIEPAVADKCTMGNSCLIQARETDSERPFIPPEWADKFPDDAKLQGRVHRPSDIYENYWWMELGGDRDSLNDAEYIRDDLIKLSYGIWDHVKNHGDHGAENWELDWAGYLPGKRESRRYVGDHTLTQNDVQKGRQFDDVIAYGGRSIDNHPPGGFNHVGEPTSYFNCKVPFDIPYRCIYSVNIENLMFAGRNISTTHAAMAASRVMGTCAILGQAAGTAASLAVKYGITPRDVGGHMDELQQLLVRDDCYIPRVVRKISDACMKADLTAQCDGTDALRNGTDRPVDGADNGCTVPLGSRVTYSLDRPTYVGTARMVFDSDLERRHITGGAAEYHNVPTICNRPLAMPPFGFPTTMVDSFELYADGRLIASVKGNRRRVVILPVEKEISELTLIPLSTCGDASAHIFAFDFE